MKNLSLFLVAVILFVGLSSYSQGAPVLAHGGQNHECSDAIEVNPVNGNLATYTAPTGTISSVCIKSGSAMFGGEHGMFSSDQTYSNCYAISGIGTSTVTVTRVGSGKNCQELSHIDVYTTTGQVNPTPTPTDTVIPTGTPTPTVTVEPTVTLTPTDSVDQEPTPTPTEPIGIGGGPNETPTPTPTPTTQLENTPTPTNSPSNNSQGGGSTTTNSNTTSGDTGSSQKQGDILGVSTLAATGTGGGVLATLETVLGALSTLGGAMLYGKKKTKKATRKKTA
jgi:hypothetical protein